MYKQIRSTTPFESSDDVSMTGELKVGTQKGCREKSDMGDLKGNYADYMTTEPINCNEEL